MELQHRFLRLKQQANSISSNPLLNYVEDELLDAIEEAAGSDGFILSKKKSMLDLTRDIDIHFSEKLKTAFDEYSEALAYLFLKRKFPRTAHIVTRPPGTPDFVIPFQAPDRSNLKGDQKVYAELKTMSFTDGNRNYTKAMDGAVESKIDIEQQVRAGKRLAFGESVIQPWLKENRSDYSPYSFKYLIEVFTEKIDQNIKRAQYALGDTVLLVDQQQLIVPNTHMEGGVPLHISRRGNAVASGIQWNVALGRFGQDIFSPIEYEGCDNIERGLNTEGILWKYDYIKAICFLHAPGKTPYDRKVLGLYRRDTVTDAVLAFLEETCDFINDDYNSRGWEQIMGDRNP